MPGIISKKAKAEKIIEKHADMIYRIALQNLKNQADAEDIFQDVCITLLTKEAPLDDDAHIKHWLIRVTINKCNNLKKSLWHKRTDSIDDYTELVAPQTQSVLEELFRLPASYRNIIYLYYYEEYTVAEIAEILKKNKNTVNSQLQRARKKLKNILEEGDKDEK